MPTAASTEKSISRADNLTAFAPNICFICLKRQLKRLAKQLLMNILAIAIHLLISGARPRKGKVL